MLFVFMLDFCIYFCRRFFIDDVFLFFKIGEKDNWFVFVFDLVLSFVKRFWNEMLLVGNFLQKCVWEFDVGVDDVN